MTAAQGVHVVGESGGCVHGGDRNSSPSTWPWLQWCPMHTVSDPPRGHKTATMAQREEGYEVNDTIGQKTPPSAAFFRKYDEEDAKPGLRPPGLGDKIQSGTVQSMDHMFVPVQILDEPVPLMGALFVAVYVAGRVSDVQPWAVVRYGDWSDTPEIAFVLAAQVDVPFHLSSFFETKEEKKRVEGKRKGARRTEACREDGGGGTDSGYLTVITQRRQQAMVLNIVKAEAWPRGECG